MRYEGSNSLLASERSEVPGGNLQLREYVMSAATTFDPLQITDRLYTMVKSLSAFDKMEVRGVIQTLLSTSGRERCFIGTYYRAMANIETLLEFKQAKHFQDIATLARGVV
jgi:hypothetical protein